MLGRLETSDQAGSGLWGAFKLWAEPASGRDAKKVRKGALSPSCFPSSGSVRLGMQPWLSPPLLPPVRAHAQLALALSCLSNRLSPVPVLSQPPHSHACPGGCGASLGRAQGPLPSFSLQQHACHQVTGLMPEPCQSLQLCPCPGTSGIQELGLGAILHLYSGLRARHCPSTLVTLAMSQGGNGIVHSPARAASKGPWDPSPRASLLGAARLGAPQEQP